MKQLSKCKCGARFRQAQGLLQTPALHPELILYLSFCRRFRERGFPVGR